MRGRNESGLRMRRRIGNAEAIGDCVCDSAGEVLQKFHLYGHGRGRERPETRGRRAVDDEGRALNHLHFGCKFVGVPKEVTREEF